jgi:hypothetical protein
VDAGALLIAAVVLSPALLALGSGPIDGDAAAYAVGRWNERWTHAAYVLLLRIVDGDLLSWIACWLAAVGAARMGGRLAAAGTAAVLLPWAPFAEVEPLWIAAMVWAASGPWWLAAVGVAFSPTALLATPWVGRRGVLAGMAAVAVLTVISGGDWWYGPRGVAEAVLLPGRTLAEWGRWLPWALLPLADRRCVLLAPLLLAPPDVPAWTLMGIAWSMAQPGRRDAGLYETSVAAAVPAACAEPGGSPGPWVPASRRHEPWVVALVLAQIVIGSWQLWRRCERVQAEDAVVDAVVARLGPEVGLIAPWTWGARIAVRASGDPYGIRWHPPGRWLRDQRTAWCADPPSVVLVVGGGACDSPCGEPPLCVPIATPPAW